MQELNIPPSQKQQPPVHKRKELRQVVHEYNVRRYQEDMARVVRFNDMQGTISSYIQHLPITPCRVIRTVIR